MSAMQTNTIDPEEVAKFEAMAAEWWDPNGKFKPLHQMNPVRLEYIVSQICATFGRDPESAAPLKGLRLLDIDYRNTPAEALAEAGEKFDVVLNMEVVEHVSDPLAFLTACRQLLKPGGLMVCSTLNRNPKSYAMAIFGAEVIMRWLPRGTHDWNKFITPDELSELIANAGLELIDKKGFVFNPLQWSWSISDRDLSVNYVTAAINPN